MKNFKITTIILAVAMFLSSIIPAYADVNEKIEQDNEELSYAKDRIHPLDSGKEVLFYLFYTVDEKLKDDVENMQKDLNLTDEEIKNIKEIALNEYLKDYEIKMKDMKNEFRNTERAVNDFNKSILDITDKRNDQLLELFKTEDRKVTVNKINDFRNWVAKWWEEERVYRNQMMNRRADIDRVSNIWATQYVPNTSESLEVALPDKKLKFANLGWSGGYSNPPYEVNVYSPAYNKSLIGIEVLDVGPWNEDDNYWDSNRRVFDDIGLGIPEAFAAFNDDYNDGKDQFGRIILNPAGIDLSTKAAKKLGYGIYESGWVDVRYEYLP